MTGGLQDIGCNEGITVCSNADTCDGSGTCNVNHLSQGHEGNGTGCPVCEDCNGSGSCADVQNGQTDVGCNESQTMCSDADTCDGGGNCLLNHLSAGHEGNGVGCPVCQDCDGSGACEDVDAGQTDIGCNEGQTVCSNADTCDGGGNCLPNHLGPGAEGNAPGCAVCEDCDGSGSCGDVNAGDQDVGCDAPATQCSGADTCSGSGDCLANHFPADTLCPGNDGEECNSDCDGAGNCQEGQSIADHTPCESSTGICCSQLCETGWACCTADDCDDGNQCTNNACLFGTCENPCTSTSCMILDVTDPVPVSTPAPLTIEMCPQNLDTDQFVCFSSRNQRALVEEHFEVDFGAFTSRGGTVTRIAGAQNPNSPGNTGVQICNNGSWMALNINTTGRYDLALVFAISNRSLDDNEMVGVYYSPNGSAYRNMALVGDNLTTEWQYFTFILPPDAENNANLWISFFQVGGDNGDCAYVDDVYLIDLLPLSKVSEPLATVEFTAFGPFFENDPQGNDVTLTTDGVESIVQIDDNEGAYIETTDAIDTTAVSPYNLLVVEWEWRDTNDGMDNADDYVMVEVSYDDGATWRQLSATGQNRVPSNYTRYRAVLPCQAIGTRGLKLGFVAPTSADNMNDNEGIRINRVSVFEFAPQWIDWFDPFTDAGNGIFTSDVNSDTSGTASIQCRYGCGAAAVWSNTDSVTFSP